MRSILVTHQDEVSQKWCSLANRLKDTQVLFPNVIKFKELKW